MSVNKLFGCYQCDQKRQRDKDTFILIKGNIYSEEKKNGEGYLFTEFRNLSDMCV